MFELNGDLLGGLDQLADDIEEHVVRSVAHAGALVFYEEARTLAPVYRGTEKKGVRPGQLREAIYRAFADQQSTAGQAVYRISWNAKKAPHGHLIENGHWLVRKVNGKKERLRWVPPHSFIRRAFDRAPAALEAMRERAVQKMAEALQRSVVDDFGNEVAVGMPYDS
ncbi:HK97 gp10 family phage protein [Ralstonia pseudosolanacearum]|uniref:HK97 gp10 family phage protein n=1 Tax=Ralstonia pseudosolanacearum TaxID=1310165 RepID=UPI0023DCA8EF|nr:HK97 gp10 family phage protein [Ralstonia pseudosolanacearum]